jgi:hypothetical protein
MHLFKYFLMPKMQAIIISDGENSATMLLSAVMQAADDLCG